MAKSNLKLDLSLENIITCVVYAVIGLLLCILRLGSLDILMTIIGVVFIALGIFDIVKSKDYLKGGIEIGIGVVLIVFAWALIEFVLLVFGILLLVKGVIDIAKNYKAGIKALIVPIVIAVIGALFIVSNFAWTIAEIIIIVAGIFFIVNAVLTLFGMSLIKKK